MQKWTKCYSVLCCLLLAVSVRTASDRDYRENLVSILPPPRDVFVDSVEDTAFLLRWKPPHTPKQANVKLMGYMLSWSPVSARHRIHDEKTVMLPGVVTSKLVSNLSEATEYAVVLSAVYPNIQTSPAPKLIIRTDYAVSELPIADDTFVEHKIECNCSEPGMLACTRTSLDSVECACYEGYQGRWCEKCSVGYVKSTKECIRCPCSNITSTGLCDVDVSTGTPRCECLPGHRGPDCGQCKPGYHRSDDRCKPINCLSYTLCQEEPHRPGCQDCDFSSIHESFYPVAQKSSDSFARGTLTVIAILSGFCFLLFAATLATCYHHRKKSSLLELSNSPTYWNAMPPEHPECNEYVEMNSRHHFPQHFDQHQALGTHHQQQQDYARMYRSLQREHVVDTMVSMENDTTPKIARARSEDFCL